MMRVGLGTSSARPDTIPITFVQGCGERLPFTDRSFDFVIMGNALRHVPDLEETFREYFRVLKPGGRVLLLEVTRPASRLGFGVARFYFGNVVPLMARIASADAARLMRFYWDTIVQAVTAPTVLASLEAAGFTHPTRYVALGILTEYRATKA
jgi:demethylmenaquinone methyltransferase/2-methoxy-6-polyprenyl-1,4-benzoquinol methylase